MQQSVKRQEARETYESPALTRLEPKQAMDFLLYHASLGDSGAKDILKLLTPLTRDNSD